MIQFGSWRVNSGTSTHMANDEIFFTELCPELQEELVLLANEQSDQVEEGIVKEK
jgi:hypothetical protein